MVSVGGNLYSVPDTTRRRVFDVHVLADEIRIFENGELVASHLPLEGRGEKRLDPGPSKARWLFAAPRVQFRTRNSFAGRRPRAPALARLLCSRGRRLAARGAREMSASAVIEPVKASLVALKMPRALEILDVTLRGIERGEIGAVEAIDALLTKKLTIRENRRVKMAVQMAKLSAIKTLTGFDFAFQP